MLPPLERESAAQFFSRPSVWYSALPIYFSLGLALVSIVQLIRSRPDSAEVVRLIAIAIATPFLISGMFLSHEWQPALTAIGAMIFLAGSTRYHVLQGERAQFVGRFVSPEVARLVRERGLERALERTRVEISALVCDLRGFTRFSELVSSDAVTRLLEEYYDAVGSAVAEAGGTIKDHSGDGVLTLFGAPILLPDHAPRSVAAARTIRERTAPILRRWSLNGCELGDDDDAVCFVLQDVLTRAGWRVIQIQDGGEIWPILEHEPVRAILLDLNMPGVNGWEVLRRLRSEPELVRRRSEFRVVIVSGQSDRSSRDFALSVGADEFLAKPIDLNALHAALEFR
jgi:CheY-like chemotaxis protein